MKKIWLALKMFLLLFLIFGCKNSSEPTVSNPPKENQQEKPKEEETNPEQKLLEKASKALNIQNVIDEKTDHIVLPEKLSSAEFKDIKISWVSQNKDVITNTGIVKHKDTDKSDTVRLTAILKLKEEATTKVFNITVKNKPFSNDLKTLNLKAANLTLPSVINSSTTSILLKESDENVKISWKSSNTQVINVKTKVVTHSDKEESDTVVLTATLTLNNESILKEFIIEVQNTLSDQKMVELASSLLEIPRVVNEEDNRISLPKNIPKYPSVTISWRSNDTSIIDPALEYPVKHKDGANDDTVILTATLKKGECQRERAYSVTVKNYRKTYQERETEKEQSLINQMKNTLSIPSKVLEYTNSVSLPLKIYEKQYENINISWKSSNALVISDKGEVTHTVGNKDDTVTLTATFTGTYVTDTKEYLVIVSHPTSVAEDSRILEIAKNNVTAPIYSNYTSLTENIKLPTNYKVDDKNVSLYWSISGGKVGSFEYKEYNLMVRRDVQDIILNMEVSLHYNNQDATKTFDFVIPGYKKFDDSNTSMTYYWEFKDNNILEQYTKDSNNSVRGKRYSFTNLNMDNDTLTLTLTEEYRENQWVNLESEYQAKVPLFDNLESKINIAISSPSIENLHSAMSAYSALYNETITEDQVYEVLIQSGCFEGITEPTSDNVLVAKAMDDKTKEESVTKFLIMYKELMALNASIPSSSSWHDIIQAMKNNLVQQSVSYEYTINNERQIAFKALYNDNKEWYEQEGFYSSPYASFHIYKNNMFSFVYKIDGRDRNCSVKLSDNKNSFEASYNENGSTIVDGTWTINPDSYNKNISVSKPGFNYTLDFVGSTLN